MIKFTTLPKSAFFASCLTITATQLNAAVFDWGDFTPIISDVQDGDSFTFNNVDGTGVDFTFTFTEVLSAATQASNPNFDTIISPSNPATDFPTSFTEQRDSENVYTDLPLGVVGESINAGDGVLVTITTSQAIIYDNFIIGDIDRLGSNNPASSYEDHVTITSSLLASSVGVNLTTTSSNITISGNTAEATSGGPGTSSSPITQIQVDTLGAVDTFNIFYQNSDTFGGGFNVASGLSNSHLITFGVDAGLTNFTVASIPEPSSTALLGLGGIALLMRRRR